MATFTRYQKFVVAVLAFLQFTTVLDFMILSPLGAILLEKLGITTKQFGLVVSAYAFSAGIAGVLTAGFADKFDRKRLLLFFDGDGRLHVDAVRQRLHRSQPGHRPRTASADLHHHRGGLDHRRTAGGTAQ